jgi:hypothetical protein
MLFSRIDFSIIAAGVSIWLSLLGIGQKQN